MIHVLSVGFKLWVREPIESLRECIQYEVPDVFQMLVCDVRLRGSRRSVSVSGYVTVYVYHQMPL